MSMFAFQSLSQRDPDVSDCFHWMAGVWLSISGENKVTESNDPYYYTSIEWVTWHIFQHKRYQNLSNDYKERLLLSYQFKMQFFLVTCISLYIKVSYKGFQNSSKIVYLLSWLTVAGAGDLLLEMTGSVGRLLLYQSRLKELNHWSWHVQRSEEDHLLWPHWRHGHNTRPPPLTSI